jgi:hypothetical protein
MSELPDAIRAEVITELYQQASDLDWEILPVAQKKIQYRRWVEDPRVGGRLRGFFDDHRIGTWIKDTPMKEYTRAQEGFGSMAAYAVRRFPGPEHLIYIALGEDWKIQPGSLDEKPMHCTVVSDEAKRYICWGRPNTFRDLTWAALTSAVTTQTRPMIIVTLQDGLVVSAAERAFQRSIAEHCRVDIRHVHRRLEMA